MAQLKALFDVDTVKETEGVWVAMDHGIEIKIARLNSPAYRAEVERQRVPYRVQIRTGTLSDKQAESILTKSLARAIIKDWRGVTDEKDKPLPFSIEEAERAMDALPEFKAFVVQAASEIDVYRTEDMEDARKNSKPVSAGKLNVVETEKSS